MHVTYSERARQPSDRFALLQKATEKLEEIVGKSAEHLHVEWDRTDDANGRPSYILSITDFADSAKTYFAPDDLQPSEILPYKLEFRLRRIWGDLLQARSERLLQKLYEDGE